MRRITALAVLSVAGVIPAAASARPPVVLTQQDPLFAVKPAVILYTGDATGILGGFDGTGRSMHFGHLHWWRYTHRDARARGAVWLDDCVPDCARGAYHPYKVRVRAYKDRRGRFRRLALRYTYHGRSHTDIRGVRRTSPGAYAYFIVSAT